MTIVLVVGCAVVTVAAVALSWLLLGALKQSDAASLCEYWQEREGRDV